MCLYPKFILNRKYTATKKNNGIIPQLNDERTKYVPVGCGKCMECLRQKARGWNVRLHEELRNSKNMNFVTLSFSDESLVELEKDLDTTLTGYNLENKIVTLAVRRFLERWRKKYKTSCKHWLVTELGHKNTERIHIHGIIWTDKIKSISEIWQYGNVWIGDYVNEKTINYIVKYIYKTDPIHKYYIPVILCSKGIGNNYLNRYDSKNNVYNGKKTNELYNTRNGLKLPMPTYYRNKIYTDEQKEKLWLNLLDKNIRYVNGIKIDVSNNETDYYKVLEEQRHINKKLGYGDDEKDWNRIKYEQNLRNIKRLERIKKENETKEINEIKYDPAEGIEPNSYFPISGANPTGPIQNRE